MPVGAELAHSIIWQICQMCLEDINKFI